MPQISYSRLANGLTQPVHIADAGDGSGRIFVVEQPGRIRIIKNGLLQTTPFLDIMSRVLLSGEQGLLSVAFPPLYASKNYFYVYYADLSGNIHISRFFVTANPDIADPASEVSILLIAHPTFTNHYGGQLMFGPDGFLYLGTGDGGSGGDPNNNSQNTSALLGKMLRIDVESGVVPYAIPPGNPFVGSAASRQEIWAYGLRNPFRFSFDRLNGDLYIADVGQNLFEEVDIQPVTSGGGQNYGWNIMEGFSCFNSANFNVPLSACNTTGLTLPVFSYNHLQGDCAIIGGFVYRGQVVRSMQGLYFYGDECTGRMWGLRTVPVLQNALLFDTVFAITSFGEDQAGQLYVTNYGTGEIFRVRTPALVTGDFNGDGITDFAFLDVLGEVFYSTTPGVFINVPGSLATIVAGDFNGTGRSGIAGLANDGTVWISTDLLTFRQIPQIFTDLVSGDFNGNGKSDLAGLAPDGSVWISTDLLSFTQLNANPSLSTLVTGDFNGDGRVDLAGLTSDGSIYYTTDLTTWTNIPGTLNQLVSGHFNSNVLIAGDQLAGLALDGTVWLSTDLLTFKQIPGSFVQIMKGNFNGDLTTDLAGLTSGGSISYTTDFTNYASIAGPGFLTQMASGNFGGVSPDAIVGITVDGSLWLTTDRATWTSIGPVRGTCHNPGTKIGGTSAYYSAIQTAYGFAAAGQSIQIQALDFVENLSLANPISVAVRGGFACDYLTNTGVTTIHGSVTIIGGTVSIENVILQ